MCMRRYNTGRKFKKEWTSNLAYGIGLITTDGNLSPDMRHIIFVSKDLEQIENFKKCFGLTNKISNKKSGFNEKAIYFVTQFGNV